MSLIATTSLPYLEDPSPCRNEGFWNSKQGSSPPIKPTLRSGQCLINQIRTPSRTLTSPSLIKEKSPTEIPMVLQDRAEIPETPVRLDLVVLADLADPEDPAEIPPTPFEEFPPLNNQIPLHIAAPKLHYQPSSLGPTQKSTPS